MTNVRRLSQIAFPAFSGINVNMMPYRMGDPDSIPAYLHGYLNLVAACPIGSEAGEIGYLTIDERVVEQGSHRRGGVHTEGFGPVAWGGGGWGGGYVAPNRGSWGGGSWGGGAVRRDDDDGLGGLWLANSVPGSCAIYDTAVLDSGPGGEVRDDQVAGIDPLLMDDQTLYWIHDRTPHASLPCRPGPRQFFRLVSSDVSVWYADHSTPNPLGIEPRGRIITGSKFA